MRTERLTFVGHSYHQQTRSSDFMREILSSHFQIAVLWDDGWRDRHAAISAGEINQTRPDAVLFYQQLARTRELARVRCRNITFMPMHDAVDHGARSWRKLRPSGIKVVCFSDFDERFFKGLGFEVLGVRFFPPPVLERPPQSDNPALRVFFWPRTKDITWYTLKALLGERRPDKVIFRVAPDPGFAVAAPGPRDQQDYNVEVHEGWMEKERYFSLLDECSVFMAPRSREGIGKAMLEAVSRGCAVIAPDAPTMNEYIRHGVNGYLYDPHAPAALDLSNLAEVGRRAQQDCAIGHGRWLEAIPQVVTFVQKEPAQRRSAWWGLRYGLRP